MLLRLIRFILLILLRLVPLTLKILDLRHGVDKDKHQDLFYASFHIDAKDYHFGNCRIQKEVANLWMRGDLKVPGKEHAKAPEPAATSAVSLDKVKFNVLQLSSSSSSDVVINPDDDRLWSQADAVYSSEYEKLKEKHNTTYKTVWPFV